MSRGGGGNPCVHKSIRDGTHVLRPNNNIPRMPLNYCVCMESNRKWLRVLTSSGPYTLLTLLLAGPYL